MVERKNNASLDGQSGTVSRRQFASLALGAGTASGLSTTALAAAPVATRIGADDRFAILELMARYAWAYDAGDAELFADTFTPDGVLVAWGEEAGKGRDGLIALAEQLFEKRGEQDWLHMVDHHVFQGDAKGCVVYSYYHMLEGSRTEKRFSVRSFGYYVSYCKKLQGEWYFTKRTINRWNSKQVPWKG
ncbi:MAG: nuclear transport factor 2 family protein [Steroidobacteraceae bacterium]